MKKGDLVLVMWTHDQQTPPETYGIVTEFLGNETYKVLLGKEVVTLHKECLVVVSGVTNEVI